MPAVTAKYWQIAAGSEGRDYSEEFLRFGMAFVGGDDQCAAMRRVEAGDGVILKRGRGRIVAAGRVVARDGQHRGERDKPWLLDFDGWELPAYCYVDWCVPPAPVPASGLTRSTIEQVRKRDLIAAAEEILKLEVRRDFREPKATEKLTDHAILNFLIKQGLRPSAAEELTQAFNRIRLLANYYKTECRWDDVREHETRTFLVMPLLLALGWSEQQIKIELAAKGVGKVDVTCFSKAYRRDERGHPNHKDCVLVIETKGFQSGLSFAHEQAKRYTTEFPSCRAVVVTNGYCYKVYPKDGAGIFSTRPSAYLNLLSPRDAYPLDPDNVKGGLEVLRLLLTQSWR